MQDSYKFCIYRKQDPARFLQDFKITSIACKNCTHSYVANSYYAKFLQDLQGSCTKRKFHLDVSWKAAARFLLGCLNLHALKSARKIFICCRFVYMQLASYIVDLSCPVTQRGKHVRLHNRASECITCSCNTTKFVQLDHLPN